MTTGTPPMPLPPPPPGRKPTVRQARAIAAREAAQQRQSIVDAHAAGDALAKLARISGLSVRQVRRIVAAGSPVAAPLTRRQWRGVRLSVEFLACGSGRDEALAWLHEQRGDRRRNGRPMPAAGYVDDHDSLDAEDRDGWDTTPE